MVTTPPAARTARDACPLRTTGGEWVAPAAGRYFENPTPVTGQAFCEIARSDEADIDKALDAAHARRARLGQDRRRPSARSS